jgi:hypothetical protein
MNFRSILLIALVGLAGLVVSAGCQPANEALAHPTPPANRDDLVKAIQNEPGMPADQKAAAIARINSHPVPDQPTK